MSVLAAVLAAALVPAAPAASAPEPAPTAGQTVPVPLPAGVTLPAGRYDVVIRGNGTEVTTGVTVDAEFAPTEPDAADGGSVAMLLVVLGLVLAAGVGAAIAALRHGRRGGGPAGDRTQVRGRPPSPPRSGSGDRVPAIGRYRQLVALVAAEQYKQALPRLTRLEGSLPETVRPDARFYIAFALYQLGYLDEADHRLAALHREDPENVEVAYLLAYLRVQRRDFDGAELVLATRRAFLAGRARKLYGIVQYERALAALRVGDVDQAAALFEVVGQYGDLGDQVPVDLRNRHLVVGTRALGDRDVPTARSEFKTLAAAAGRLEPARRDPLLASANLGLALAAWIEDAPDAPAQIEELLVTAIRLIDPAEPSTASWRAIDPRAGLADELQALDEDRTDEQRERDRAIRDMHFLRGMAVLKAWLADPARSGAKAYFAKAMARFACARLVDPTFADPYLVVGLLLHHLSGARQREQSLAALRVARKRGVRNPEVVQILNQATERPPGDHDVSEILDLFDSYARDPTVTAAVRAEMRRRLARFGKAAEWDTRPDATAVRPAQPTVSELSERADLLAARIRLLDGPAGGSDATRAAEELARASRHLAEQARAVERQEANLLALIENTQLAEPEGRT